MKYLEKHQGSATYLVAVNGSQSAAPFILESGKAVIAMGGFGGSDPAPTLSEFKHMVATGEVHYVYVSGGTGSTGGAGGSGFGGGACAWWIAHHGRREEHYRLRDDELRHAEHKTDRSGSTPGCVRWQPTHEHGQRGRCLGREVRNQGFVQRLRR